MEILGPLRPDGPPLANALVVAENLLPRDGGYGPLRALAPSSAALPAACQGLHAVGGARTVTVAGTDRALFILEGRTWRQAGGPYPPATDGGWSFAQFGELLLAANGSTTPLKFDLRGNGDFMPLAGGAPSARVIAVVRDFVALGNLTGQPAAIRWSGLDDAESWAPSQATQADGQTMADGGEVLGIVGGEYGVILQANAIRRMSYVGTPLVFQIDKVEDNRGVLAPGSIASFGPGRIFYLSNEGFCVTDGNGPSNPIGAGKIDRAFLAELDQSNLHRISATVDAINRTYICAYPGRGNQGGRPNRLAIFNFETGEWTFADVAIDRLARHFGESVTLDGLAALGHGDLDRIELSLDSRIWQGGAVSVGAIDDAGRLAYFGGPVLPARIETGDRRGAAGRTSITGLRLHGDMPDARVRASTRERLDRPFRTGAFRAAGDSGFVSLRASGRYWRVRIETAGGADWTRVVGYDLQVTGGGQR